MSVHAAHVTVWLKPQGLSPSWFIFTAYDWYQHMRYSLEHSSECLAFGLPSRRCLKSNTKDLSKVVLHILY